jgi:hypothetical protein
MQDGAKPHATPMIKKFLRDESIELMDWPAQSPDLNPIENIWGLLKDKLYDRRDDI